LSFPYQAPLGPDPASIPPILPRYGKIHDTGPQRCYNRSKAYWKNHREKDGKSGLHDPKKQSRTDWDGEAKEEIEANAKANPGNPPIEGLMPVNRLEEEERQDANLPSDFRKLSREFQFKCPFFDIVRH